MRTAPIDIRPMKKRGIWGIARKLYGKSFAQFFLYCLLVIGIASALMMSLNYSSIASLSDMTLNGQKIFSIGDYMSSGVEHMATTGSLPILPPNESGSQNGGDYDFDYNYGYDYDITGFPEVAGVVSTIGRSMLVWVISLLLNWLLLPMFRGGMSIEVRRRFGGMRAGVREMLGGGGKALSMYFGTQACLNLVMVGVAIVMSIFVTVVALIALVPMIMSLMTGAPVETALGWLVGACLIMSALFYVVFTLFTFTYDVVANEQKRYFKAIGRSIKLVWKKLGRVLVVQLVPQLVYLLIFAAVVVGVTALLGTGSLIPVAVIAATVGAILFAPYQAIVCSVLYYDVRVRLEGGGWTEQITNAFQPAEPETDAYEPQDAPFEGESIYDEQAPQNGSTEEEP